MDRVFWRKYGRPVILSLCLMLGVIFQGCITESVPAESSLGAGDALPQFRVTLLDGDSFDTAELRDAGITDLLVVFFNTGCVDCRQTLPRLQELYERIMADGDLASATGFICIAREEDTPEVAAYWDSHSFTMPVAPQSDRKIYNLFATVGIPRVYLVNTATATITAAWSPTGISVESIFSLLE